jgi:hypothetical protein
MIFIPGPVKTDLVLAKTGLVLAKTGLVLAKTVKNKMFTNYLNNINLLRRKIMCFSGTSDRW